MEEMVGLGAIKSAVSVLRKVPSSYIGDYVVWFMIGASIMMIVSMVL